MTVTITLMVILVLDIKGDDDDERWVTYMKRIVPLVLIVYASNFYLFVLVYKEYR